MTTSLSPPRCARAWARGRPRYRRAGSRPDAAHTAASAWTCWRTRWVSRPASIQSRNRDQIPITTSCASSAPPSFTVTSRAATNASRICAASGRRRADRGAIPDGGCREHRRRPRSCPPACAEPYPLSTQRVSPTPLPRSRQVRGMAAQQHAGPDAAIRSCQRPRDASHPAEPHREHAGRSATGPARRVATADAVVTPLGRRARQRRTRHHRPTHGRRTCGRP